MMTGGTRQYTWKWMVVLALIATLLVACERPFPGIGGGDEEDQPVATETTAPPDEAVDTDADAEQPVADATAYPAPEETATSDTPRVEATETATPEPSPSPSAEPTATAVPDTEEEETADEEEEAADEEMDEEVEEEAAAAETPAADLPTTHTVAPGENLYRIGLQYGISWVTLAEYNNIANPNNIIVGQTISIPQPGETITPEPTPSPATETTYIVQPGDNLYRIGLKYGLTWVPIAEANGLVNPNQIRVGQELKIPVNEPGPAPQFTHTVTQGETLFKISLQYGVPWTAIAEANDLSSPYVIYPGQTLVIPAG